MASSMLGELCCSVCLETYTDPVTLPCTHSFCRHCLLDLSRTCSTRMPTHGGINCPECRQKTDLDEQGVMDLPKNCTLANLVEKLDKSQGKNYDPNCSICDTTPARIAVKACCECNLSYCCECVALHPSRGALAKHGLVDVNDDNSCTESLVSKKAEVRDEENDTCIFCLTCNELVEDEKSHLDHETSGLKEARMTKCTSFEATLEKLGKTRRDLRQGIYQSESYGERLQGEKQKQLRDVVESMDKVRKSLALKESELTQQINEKHEDCIYKNEMDIKNKKEQLPKISDIIIRIQMLLDQEQNDSSFLKTSMDLEKHLHSFDHSEEGESSQLFETCSVDIDIRNIASEMVNVLEEKKSDGSVINKTEQQLKEKVRLISVTPKQDSKHGHLLVKWSLSPSEQTYDVKVQVMDPERASDNTSEPTLLYSSIQQSEVLLSYLLLETKYKVSVMIHGHPETESEPIHSKTLRGGMNQQLKDKVRLISVTPKWNSALGCLLVKWSSSPSKQAYDVKVQDLDPNRASDDIQTTVYSSVKQTELLIPNLRQDTVYKVSVMIQGHPETESNPTLVKTLPFFTGYFSFFVGIASDDITFRADGKIMEHEDQTEFGSEMYDNISGTIGSHHLLPLHYWETDLRFFMGRLTPTGETAYEIGICHEKHVDNIPNIRKNRFAYVCCHSKRGRDALFEFYAKGKRIRDVKMPWQNPFELKLGFFFNKVKKQFSIINVDSGENLMTFRNVMHTEEEGVYAPVFCTGTGGGKTKVRIELNTFVDIKCIPDVVLTNLM